MADIRKILVANRGEIALRVIRSLKEMGILTVAVYSEADRLSPHVRVADQALFLGPAAANQSYLKGDRIIELCLQHQVDALHPGYGFLSENAEFARKVTQAGIIFIGPSAHSIEIMGSKLKAKAAAANYDIPMVPGSGGAVTDTESALDQAKDIGFPLLIKANAGGGGKGMRVVESADDLPSQMKRAVSEAQSAFGDGAVFLEKYIESPRHIEIQILGDQQGNVVHLFERECSIQRRHQKVIEEAPSSVLDQSLRNRMGEAAVQVARSCQYYGAGTVEFMLDKHKNFYFLEMNTRLQVEHPVTEIITGIDLVKEQVRIAEGQSLRFSQDQISLRGHAIEARIYAEDPANQFLPDTGRLTTYQRPQGPGIRIDDGIDEGMEIPIYYDPMIAKLIAYGKDRQEAIERMKRAIGEYRIAGVRTTLDFCKFVMEHPRFIAGDYDTGFIGKYFDPEMSEQVSQDLETVAAMFGVTYLARQEKTLPRSENNSITQNPWIKRAKDQ